MDVHQCEWIWEIVVEVLDWVQNVVLEFFFAAGIKKIRMKEE